MYVELSTSIKVHVRVLVFGPLKDLLHTCMSCTACHVCIRVCVCMYVHTCISHIHTPVVIVSHVPVFYVYTNAVATIMHVHYPTVKFSTLNTTPFTSSLVKKYNPGTPAPPRPVVALFVGTGTHCKLQTSWSAPKRTISSAC